MMVFLYELYVTEENMFDFCAIMAYVLMSFENRMFSSPQKCVEENHDAVCFVVVQTLMNIIRSFCYEIPIAFLQRMMEIGQHLEGEFVLININSFIICN